jgi:hypothetical protein
MTHALTSSPNGRNHSKSRALSTLADRFAMCRFVSEIGPCAPDAGVLLAEVVEAA